ncbi:DUF697 domain-containing protein [Prochlorococcus marinus]|uniref:GTP-binding protein n=1 Tax=Prochlorococcus marinus XMU1408 TaxID=2213228 RepID=A0A318QZY8_PROMR|nr:DUF697 domain-containing protein [Prochlorococcus marinus]MBW3041742.1 GTP-binding protein [Prochlorococcus marinus str. XMU1408]PYE02887.1 GTP-binding protein [Prochlorococcus marinus XMU1408]
MKKNNSKTILFFILIFLICLILVGIIGAIIRLINIPSILITFIIIAGLSYYKRIEWWKRIVNSLFKIKGDKKIHKFSLTSKKEAAGKSLKGIDEIIKLINDKVKVKALTDEKNRVSLELERGDIILVVFGIGSSGKTSLIRALLNKIVGEVSPEMGTTKEKKSFRLKLKGLNRGIRIIDTPGILEAGKDGREREKSALIQAGKADLMLVVIEGDLRSEETKTIRNLSNVGKRLLLVLNKIDLRGENEEKRLIDILNARCNDFINPEDIICTSASPQTIAIPGKRPYQPTPEINSLIRRLAKILYEEGEELIADNILLQCSNLGKEGKRLLVKQRSQSAKKCIDKYGWLSGGALILTPLPVVDMIAAAAVNAQMVIEIAKIYGVEITNEKAKALAISVCKILATMGLVKGGVSLISSTLSLSLPTFIVSKVIQGVSVSWLTRVAGASFITYFQQNQNWGDGGIQEVVEYHYNLNKRDEYFKSFIRRAYERVIDPIVEKKFKKLPPKSRHQREGDSSVL